MNKYIEAIEDLNEDAIVILGDFDDCIVGIAKKIDGCVIVYSEKLIIEKLSKDMSEEDALEYYNYNILGGYFGENNPVFMIDIGNH